MLHECLLSDSIINFTGLNLGSPQCYASRRLDYIDKMIIQTLAPICIALLLVVLFAFHIRDLLKRHASEKVAESETRRRNSNSSQLDGDAEEDQATEIKRSEERRQDEVGALIGRYFSLFFLITYLVLPSVTTTIAGVIPIVNVDPDGTLPGEYHYYMRHDLNVNARSARYKFGVGWAAVMFLIYPVGVPALYFYVLYYNKEKISQLEKTGDFDRKAAGEKMTFIDYISPQTISFLHSAYEAQFWYWEIVETARRLLLTAAVSIVATGSPAQIVFGIFVAVVYIKLYAYFLPYKNSEDDFLQELAQYQIFITLFISLLIQSSKRYLSSEFHLDCCFADNNPWDFHVNLL
jgi:hypothetical protein